jgi:hypothetical protein
MRTNVSFLLPLRYWKYERLLPLPSEKHAWASDRSALFLGDLREGCVDG